MSHENVACQEIYSSLGGDPDLGELVEMFVSEIPDRIAVLQASWEASDWETLRRTAHQLKGAVGSYGFDEVTPYAATLEFAVRDKLDEASIQEKVETLIEMFKRLRSGSPA